MPAAQFPQIFAGQEITTTLLDQMIPFTVIKPTDQSVTSSTVLVNDNDLQVSLAANTTWQFTMYLDFEGGTGSSSDLKFSFTVPAGAVMQYACPHVNQAGTAVLNNTNQASTTITCQTQTAGTKCGVILMGTIVMGSTAGSVVLQWAQNTSSATPTIMHAQSSFWLQRVS